MGKQKILIDQTFPFGVEKLFAELTDHENFGRMVGANIKRVKDSNSEHVNGLGAVREIRQFGVPSFQETVTHFVENESMEYTVTQGSPIKNHLGRLEFSSTEEGCRLVYQIDFEPKLPIPFLGILISRAIEKPIRKGLAGLS